MQHNRLHISTILLGISLFSLGCALLGAPATPQPAVALPTQPPTAARPAASTSTPARPTAPATPQPARTTAPTATLPLPTPTAPPFLPAALAVIGAQNAASLQPLARLPGEGASVVAFSPDGQRLAAGTFRTNRVLVWDLRSGSPLLDLQGHADPRIIAYVAFTPAGDRLVSAAQAWDAPNDSLVLWDAADGAQLKRYDGFLGALSPDGQRIALTRREQGKRTLLTISGLDNGTPYYEFQAAGDIYGILYAPGGVQVAAKMFNVHQDLFSFWSLETSRLERTLYDWTNFSYSPDGRFIAALVVKASGSDRASLNVFDAATFKWLRTLRGSTDSLWYTTPAFSPDGSVLAASQGEAVVLWDTAAWKELARLPTGGPAGALFSPDGRLLVTHTFADPPRFWGVPGK